MKFEKYQGAGNDFVLLNACEVEENLTEEKIAFLCDRKYGIGADGLIIMHMENNIPRMVYYNSDGKQSTMCGNGGRCFALFCINQKLYAHAVEFNAIDGLHKAILNSDNTVSLEMIDVTNIELHDNAFVLNTGSPHYCLFTQHIDSINIKQKGAEIRYSKHFEANGINVNFIEIIDENILKICTYERGVEDETLACGTGVTAAAISYLYKNNKTKKQTVQVHAKGGILSVSCNAENGVFNSVWLTGEAKKVFEGSIFI